jgi:hypothetical protein
MRLGNAPSRSKVMLLDSGLLRWWIPCFDKVVLYYNFSLRPPSRDKEWANTTNLPNNALLRSLCQWTKRHTSVSEAYKALAIARGENLIHDGVEPDTGDLRRELKRRLRPRQSAARDSVVVYSHTAILTVTHTGSERRICSNGCR